MLVHNLLVNQHGAFHEAGWLLRKGYHNLFASLRSLQHMLEKVKVWHIDISRLFKIINKAPIWVNGQYHLFGITSGGWERKCTHTQICLAGAGGGVSHFSSVSSSMRNQISMFAEERGPLTLRKACLSLPVSVSAVATTVWVLALSELQICLTCWLTHFSKCSACSWYMSDVVPER